MCNLSQGPIAPLKKIPKQQVTHSAGFCVPYICQFNSTKTNYSGKTEILWDGTGATLATLGTLAYSSCSEGCE